MLVEWDDGREAGRDREGEGARSRAGKGRAGMEIATRVCACVFCLWRAGEWIV